MHHTCVNEIGDKVFEESGSHDYGTTLENDKTGLPNHAKEREIEILETNESIRPKPLCAKPQAEEMNSSDITRKLVKNKLTNLRKNRNKDTKFRKSTVAGINK